MRNSDKGHLIIFLQSLLSSVLETFHRVLQSQLFSLYKNLIRSWREYAGRGGVLQPIQPCWIKLSPRRLYSFKSFLSIFAFVLLQCCFTLIFLYNKYYSHFSKCILRTLASIVLQHSRTTFFLCKNDSLFRILQNLD